MIAVALLVVAFGVRVEANGGKHVYLIQPVTQRDNSNEKDDRDRATQFGRLILQELEAIAGIEIRIADPDSPDPAYRTCPKAAEISCDTVALRQGEDQYPLSINNREQQLKDHGPQTPLVCRRGGQYCWPRAFQYAAVVLKQHHQRAHKPGAEQ